MCGFFSQTFFGRLKEGYLRRFVIKIRSPLGRFEWRASLDTFGTSQIFFPLEIWRDCRSVIFSLDLNPPRNYKWVSGRLSQIHIPRDTNLGGNFELSECHLCEPIVCVQKSLRLIDEWERWNESKRNDKQRTKRIAAFTNWNRARVVKCTLISEKTAQLVFPICMKIHRRSVWIVFDSIHL